MKSKARFISVLAAALMVYSLPAFGAGGEKGQDPGQGLVGQKDECLLVARDCSSDSINARVDRIEREISKGTAVYTDSELNKLQQELKDAVRIQQIYNNHFPPVSI
jgi:hypothetical protein